MKTNEQIVLKFKKLGIDKTVATLLMKVLEEKDDYVVDILLKMPCALGDDDLDDWRHKMIDKVLKIDRARNHNYGHDGEVIPGL